LPKVLIRIYKWREVIAEVVEVVVGGPTRKLAVHPHLAEKSAFQRHSAGYSGMVLWNLD
jgi:hypothetical protein